MTMLINYTLTTMTVINMRFYDFQFCNSPLTGSAALRNDRTDSLYNTSTVSSDFEPLPPPIPPHNVNPATLLQQNNSEPNNVQAPQKPLQLNDLTNTLEYVDSAVPEVMTPEEQQTLLSHK